MTTETLVSPLFEADETATTDSSLNAYLNAIGKIPLLEDEEQVELFRQADAGSLANELLLTIEGKRLGRLAVEHYSGDELATRTDLTTLVLEGWVARRRLVESNLRLVPAVMKEFRTKFSLFHLSPLDLVQEGNFGLIEAVNKFSARQGVFSKFAWKHIEGEMHNALAGTSKTGGEHLIRIPKNLFYELLGIRGLIYDEAEQGIGISDEQLSQKLEIPLKKIVQTRTLLQLPLSINETIIDTDGLTLEEKLPDTDQLPDETAMWTILREALTTEIATLPPRQAQALSLLYGIGVKAHEGEEAAEIMGVRKQNVYNYAQLALQKLRKTGSALGLEDFLHSC